MSTAIFYHQVSHSIKNNWAFKERKPDLNRKETTKRDPQNIQMMKLTSRDIKTNIINMLEALKHRIECFSRGQKYKKIEYTYWK